MCVSVRLFAVCVCEYLCVCVCEFVCVCLWCVNVWRLCGMCVKCVCCV